MVGRDLCERLLEMPGKQAMCSFAPVNFFSPSFLLFSFFFATVTRVIYGRPSLDFRAIRSLCLFDLPRLFLSGFLSGLL